MASAASESLYSELDTLSGELNVLDTSVTEALTEEAPAAIQQGH
jgi:hypothetical protein